MDKFKYLCQTCLNSCKNKNNIIVIDYQEYIKYKCIKYKKDESKIIPKPKEDW